MDIKDLNHGRGSRRYPVPSFLQKIEIKQNVFGSWLDRVTAAHVRRDRKRLTKKTIKPAIYRLAIYLAVKESNGKDFYTGEALDWTLLEHFAGKKTLQREQKKVPTLDHHNLSAIAPIFRICSMRTNKCKSDFSISEVLEFAKSLIQYQNRKSRTGKG